VPLSENVLELKVNLPADPALEPGMHYVEVELYADALWKQGRWQAGAVRQRAQVAVDRPFALNGTLNFFGIPTNRGPVRFPLEVEPGGEAKAHVTLLPASVSQWSVKSCTARHVISRAAVDQCKPRRLRPSSLCDGNWTNGIWTHTAERAGFFINDLSLLRRIAPGDRLRFAKSGERKVESIAGDQVWVAGDALDPAGDGYPHAVVVEH
jgi:hypothetical protein